MRSDNLISFVLLLLLAGCAVCRSTPDATVTTTPNPVAIQAEDETISLPLVATSGTNPNPTPTVTVVYVNIWYARNVLDDQVYDNGYWSDTATFYNPTTATTYFAVCQEEFDDEPIEGETQYSFDGQYFYPINDARFQTFRVSTPPGK